MSCCAEKPRKNQKAQPCTTYSPNPLPITGCAQMEDCVKLRSVKKCDLKYEKSHMLELMATSFNV